MSPESISWAFSGEYCHGIERQSHNFWQICFAYMLTNRQLPQALYETTVLVLSSDNMFPKKHSILEVYFTIYHRKFMRYSNKNSALLPLTSANGYDALHLL